MTRAKYVSGPQEVAAGGYLGSSYYIAELRAGDMEDKGIFPTPDPTEENPGHVIIRSINVLKRESEEVQEQMVAAKNLILRIHGPYPGTREKPKRAT